jgi:hypothetical protein
MWHGTSSFSTNFTFKLEVTYYSLSCLLFPTSAVKGLVIIITLVNPHLPYCPVSHMAGFNVESWSVKGLILFGRVCRNVCMFSQSVQTLSIFPVCDIFSLSEHHTDNVYTVCFSVLFQLMCVWIAVCSNHPLLLIPLPPSLKHIWLFLQNCIFPVWSDSRLIALAWLLVLVILATEILDWIICSRQQNINSVWYKVELQNLFSSSYYKLGNFCVYVCLCVCLSVCPAIRFHISQRIFSKFGENILWMMTRIVGY